MKGTNLRSRRNKIVAVCSFGLPKTGQRRLKNCACLESPPPAPRDLATWGGARSEGADHLAALRRGPAT